MADEKMLQTDTAFEKLRGLRGRSRKTVAQVSIGAAVLGVLYLAGQHLRLARDGQVTGRFGNAVKLLGEEELETRLGGIYALERVARDAPGEHWHVMEALTAYARKNAPVCLENGDGHRPPGDILAVVTVIRRREKHRPEQPLDFSNTCLRWARLRRADLRSADLERSDLREANLWGADLRSADLGGADLRGANLRNADLRGAGLRSADLGGADLWGANLGRVDLRSADLAGANLGNVHLGGADLSGSGITETQLKSARFNERTVLPDHLRQVQTAK